MFPSWEQKNRNHYVLKIEMFMWNYVKNKIRNNVVLIIITQDIIHLVLFLLKYCSIGYLGAKNMTDQMTLGPV